MEMEMVYGVGGLILFILAAGGLYWFNKKHKRKTTYNLKMRVGSDINTVLPQSVTPGMEVIVAFDEMLLKHSEDGSPIVKNFEGGKEINLLDTSSKISPILTEMNQEELPSGRYEWIRLKIIADRCFVRINNEVFPMKIPSGEQSGLKLVRGFFVHGIGRSDFTIDFNVRKGMTRKSDGTYILKPALKLIDNTGREEDVDLPEELTEERYTGRMTSPYII